MGLILIPLKSVAKLQLPSTVEGLVPIWHQFQYQKSPCWNLWGVYYKLFFHQKKQNWLELKYFPGTCWFWQDAHQEIVSQLRHRNDQGHSGLGVHLGIWAPGLKFRCGGTAPGDLKQHCHFPSRKPPAFWLCWVSFALVLVKQKTSVTLPLSPCIHLHNDGRYSCWQKCEQP